MAMTKTKTCTPAVESADEMMIRMPRVKSEGLAEAARLLRSIVGAVEAGELEATTPRAVAMVRRIEGAAAALEAASESKG